MVILMLVVRVCFEMRPEYLFCDDFELIIGSKDLRTIAID
jgi:hypothetical protein